MELNFSKTFVIFDTSSSGHHIEYIKHIIQYATVSQHFRFIFVVPSMTVEQVKGICDNCNIIFDSLPRHVSERCNKSILMLGSYYQAKYMGRYARKYHADEVIHIMLMHCLPFISFFMPKNTKVSGIIYRIYLYSYDKLPIRKRFEQKLLHCSIAWSDTIKYAFVLNDMESVEKLNKMFHTNKYKYIVDPFPTIDYIGKDIRTQLGITSDKKIFLHFGSLDVRKGTMIILDSLSYIPNEESKKYAFIFAGRISLEIKKDFYKKIKDLQDRVLIIVKDKFLSYEELNDLCQTCDEILIPYSNTQQSSGVIGYSSQYGKPLVGPSDALLGELIRKYQLGLTVENITPQSLANIYSCQLDRVSKNYVNTHKVIDFNQALFE